MKTETSATLSYPIVFLDTKQGTFTSSFGRAMNSFIDRFKFPVRWGFSEEKTGNKVVGIVVEVMSGEADQAEVKKRMDRLIERWINKGVIKRSLPGDNREDLDSLRRDIAKAVRVIKHPQSYSAQIIGFSLRIIADKYGKAEANRAIKNFDLERHGWRLEV